ncbi:MAG: hypothetical protein IJW33_01015 [Lentisphaeria bacterium]|nr:hypothetical protein [Lentisphaeria bacterium]
MLQALTAYRFSPKTKLIYIPFHQTQYHRKNIFLQYYAKVFNDMDDKSLIRVELKKIPSPRMGKNKLSEVIPSAG